MRGNLLDIGLSDEKCKKKKKKKRPHYIKKAFAQPRPDVLEFMGLQRIGHD